MLHSYLTPDGLRATAVLLLAIGQAVMSQWPYWRKWPETIPTRSASHSTPVVPIDWTFAIWGVIFLGCLAFAVWQVLPGNLTNPLLRSLGWWAAAAFALNVAWQYVVPRHDIGWPSVAIIVAELAVLLAILVTLETAEPHGSATYWWVVVPFELLAGWISAATFVNLSSTLRLRGVDMGTGRSIGLIATAVFLATVVGTTSGALVYGAVVAWALLGIVVANRVRTANRAVALFAGVLMPVALTGALIGALIGR